MEIYCCGCESKVDARLTSGKEIYPHRPDLFSIPMWKCDSCKNYVGCHHKTKDRTRPLGCIPTKAVMQLRKKIHATLDPIWKNSKRKQVRRRALYAIISEKIGRKYHTANIRSVEEGEHILGIVNELAEAG